MLKAFVRIIFVIIYFVIVLIAFGNSIDVIPFDISDIIVAMFAFGGVIYWAEFGTNYIILFIEWLKNRGSLK